MYKLNCILVSSANNIYRQLSASLNSNVNSLCGSNGLHRAICTTAVRLADAAAPTTEETLCTTAVRLDAAAPTTEETSGEFSYFPPMPGEKSLLRWDGKTFEELPIAHIKATFNNTHIQVTDSAGLPITRVSCGTEGFKNVKKSTPIAAQTTGISAGAKAKVKGVKFVRVVVQGLGLGRLSAIQGLVMGGLEVVSITDTTPVPHNGCRPRKARRL
ncbi:small ribosomal subunit protein uS11m-like [Brachionichthys hirsutus]|uniref:small ribosomal subunit protein uS11m-like n=1 Tax=Brachionichthys hirsutus TaxID=412623 RepID=UPI003604C041